MPAHEIYSNCALDMYGMIHKFCERVPRIHQRSWKKMLCKTYPELAGETLPRMMHKLVVRCWVLRRTLTQAERHDFVEFCAGQGNLSSECIRLGMAGATLDIDYTPDHNMMTARGLRIMIDCISRSKISALHWWGTRCSSHVPACYFHHQRNEANGFWGDESLDWVRNGNLQQVPRCGMVANAG